MAAIVDSAHWRAHARRHPLRYRLAIIAPNALEVVRHAGGWLFDQTTAGWEVTVLVIDHSDVRPLRILGATVLDFEQSLAEPKHDTWPHALAAPAQMCATDPRVREGILHCLDHGAAEVALWGDALPDEFAQRVGTAHHPVSRAARAFKACAVASAGHPGEKISATEVFSVGALRHTAGLVSAS
ncbi:hypothetical protein [Nocardia rosealba]|uniref:hypothetical protein n=1 Tax=Nocardia rosealba TaxID=2878563 RepID=UPI001CD99256|nr:hypothetical protein [Nocardia rosealba]MCA2207837.1 hypothetical protein [Nocardia rosealba]